MKKQLITFALAVSGLLCSNSCGKYLDIVPDNVPTLDRAFNMRTTAERYLFTCYSYMGSLANFWNTPWIWGADESWIVDTYNFSAFNLAKNMQNKNAPIDNFWGRADGSVDAWEAISQCNIFLDNVDKVTDMESDEKARWKAEAMFLKAFYHFFMLRAYGPIPILDQNIPVSASGDQVRVSRQPVDQVFNYIVNTLDKAIPDLPDVITDEYSELGRITKAIALGFKGKVLVYAASPLFNGNQDYSGFLDKEGNPFFNQTYDVQKWEKAAGAVKVAIDFADSVGYKLYEFQGRAASSAVSDETRVQMNYRGVNTQRWNSEVIWGLSGAKVRQDWFAPKALTPQQKNYIGTNGTIGITLNLVDQFYTANGVPIQEDKTWDYAGRSKPRKATDADKYRIKPGQTTASYNFDREPRFYGGLGFDRGIWYGNGEWDDNKAYWLQMREGEWLGVFTLGYYPLPGYFAKKMVNVDNRHETQNKYNVIDYPRVLLRLSDLYLLYAEALNEAYGPIDEAIEYLDKIRAIAGIPDVKTAWSTYSRIPNKFTTQEGLRDIIRQERTITLAMEGSRFWDLRRWKTAPIELNKPIRGWDAYQSTYEGYYREKVLFQQIFTLKDYFWPISERDLIVNKNLVQNPGW